MKEEKTFLSLHLDIAIIFPSTLTVISNDTTARLDYDINLS